MVPTSLAKMKLLAAEAAAVPARFSPVTTKLLAMPANTWPVGAPPGVATLNGWLMVLVTPLVVTSPPYTSLRPAPFDDTQKAPPPGFSEMPQALTRVGSVIEQLRAGRR